MARSIVSVSELIEPITKPSKLMLGLVLEHSRELLLPLLWLRYEREVEAEEVFNLSETVGSGRTSGKDMSGTGIGLGSIGMDEGESKLWPT